MDFNKFNLEDEFENIPDFALIPARGPDAAATAEEPEVVETATTEPVAEEVVSQDIEAAETSVEPEVLETAGVLGLALEPESEPEALETAAALGLALEPESEPEALETAAALDLASEPESEPEALETAAALDLASGPESEPEALETAAGAADIEVVQRSWESSEDDSAGELILQSMAPPFNGEVESPDAQVIALLPSMAADENQHVKTQMSPSMDGTLDPVKILPVGPRARNYNMRIATVKEHPTITIHLEEDILVPDVKPDLETILSMDAKIKLEKTDIYGNRATITGFLGLQTLYLPEISMRGGMYGDDSLGFSDDENTNPSDSWGSGQFEGPLPLPNIVTAESRMLFKRDVMLKAQEDNSANGMFELQPVIQSMEHFVINERKYRVRAVVEIEVKEYCTEDISSFEGILGDDIQMLRQPVNFMDIIARKKDLVEVKETFPIDESTPSIQRILKCDVQVAEGNKQIIKSKAIVSGTLLMQVLYIGEDGGEVLATIQQKAEFTHFIKLTDFESKGMECGEGESLEENVTFQVTSAMVNPTMAEDGSGQVLELVAEVSVNLDVMKNVRKKAVVDLYHKGKDLQYSVDYCPLTGIQGSGEGDTSVRELITLPEGIDVLESVPYLNCTIKNQQIVGENGRCVVTGNIAVESFCMSPDAPRGIFTIYTEVPFKCVIDMAKAEMAPEYKCSVWIKDLWYDKVNSQQIEVNCSIGAKAMGLCETSFPMIRDLCYLEEGSSQRDMPSMIIYVTKPGDTLWKIAKNFKTTTENLVTLNGIVDENLIYPGQKLLIV